MSDQNGNVNANEIQTKGSGPDFSDQKLKGKKFKGENLAGAVFSGTDLTNARFINCDLTGVKFLSAKMTNFRIEGGTLDKIVFTDCNGSKARFKGITLRQGKFEKSDFSGTSFQKCTFEDCDFVDADLSGAALYNMSITGGSISGSILDQVRAPDIKITGTVLSKSSCKKGDLVSSVIKELEANELDLSESDLSGARLNTIKFNKCKFDHTEMIACDFTDSSFTDCDFAKTAIKYSRGLSEDDLEMIKEKGGKVGLDIVRKLSNFLFYTKYGRILVGIMVVLFIGYLGYRTFVPSSWSYGALVAEAKKAQDRIDHDGIKKYNKIIANKYADQPDKATLAHMNLGQVFIEERDFKNAYENYKKAFGYNEQDPYRHAGILVGLGDASLGLNDTKEAKKWFEMILKGDLDEGYKAPAVQGLAKILHMDGESEKALEWINKALADDAYSMSEANLTNEKVAILTKLKRYDEAVAILETLIQTEDEGRSRDAYLKLAEIEKTRGNRERALEIFNEMVKKFPDTKDYLDNSNITKAQTMLAEGNPKEGEKILLQIIDEAINPRTRRYAKSSLAMHYLYTQRAAEAEKLFEELMKEVSEDEHDYWAMVINYAMLKQQRGEVDEAMKWLDKAIAAEHNDQGFLRWAYQERASAHQVNGDIDKAVEDLEGALAASGEQIFREEVLVNLIQMVTYHGDPKQGIKIGNKYKDELKDSEQKNRFMSLLAKAYDQSGDTEMALKLYRELADQCQKGDKCWMHYNIELINATHNSGEIEKALAMFKKFVEGEFSGNGISDNCNSVMGLFSEITEANDLFVTYYTKILDAFRENKNFNHNYFTAFNNLAERYQMMGQVDRALELYRQVISECNEDFPRLQAFENILKYHMEIKDFEAASETIDEVAKVLDNPRGKVAADIFRADLYNQTDRIDDAIELLNKTLGYCQDDNDCCRTIESLFGFHRMKGERVKMRSLYDKVSDKWDNCWAVKNVKTELKIN